MQFNSFLDIEYQIDIAFYRNKENILFTISHENIILVDLDFWGTFFENTGCQIIKAENYN